jgi:cytochrome c-type biogenesis protein CcmH
VKIWILLSLFAVSSAQAQMPAGKVVDDMSLVQLPDLPLEDPPAEAVAEARTKRLQHALRCPVCQGMSVADSPSDAARAMGNRIEELVREGYTEDQITEYFVDRYGAWVELEPPTDDHLVLFLTPLALLLVGVSGIALWNRRRQTGASSDDVESDPALEPWRNRILAELDGDTP